MTRNLFGGLNRKVEKHSRLQKLAIGGMMVGGLLLYGSSHYKPSMQDRKVWKKYNALTSLHMKTFNDVIDYNKNKIYPEYYGDDFKQDIVRYSKLQDEQLSIANKLRKDAHHQIQGIESTKLYEQANNNNVKHLVKGAIGGFSFFGSTILLLASYFNKKHYAKKLSESLRGGVA